ncbi:MAG TPA: GAF domain-containing protein [Opitutus sp.]|nr:GAF domain-containing protein [Opitutus sp.]
MSSPEDPRALQALYRLNSLAGRAEDTHAALRAVLDELIATFAADAGSIALLNPGSGRLETEVQVGMPEGHDPLGLKLGHGVTGWCVLNSRALLVPDVATEPRYIAVRPSARCELAAPMSDGDLVIGVIDLESDRLRGFSAADLALLERLAVEATTLVLHLWRTRHLQAKARQLETLLSTGQSLIAKLETHDLFAALTRDACRMMQARLCALYLHDAAQGTVRCVAFDTSGSNSLAPPSGDLPVDTCLAASALRTKHQVDFADVQLPGFQSVADLPPDPQLHAALFTPLIFEGDVLGVLAVFLDRLHRFDDDEKRACATLASLGAVALQNARLYTRAFQSEQMLRKNEQLTTLGLLAAEIAHEIRNPLTVLKLLFGGLNLNFQARDPRHTDVRVINEKLDQLEAIVLRVLNFAKAPAALHSHWSLSEIVGDTLVLVRQKLAQAKIKVHFEAPDQPLVVDAHKGQLQQVLLNLIFNSLEAMPAGGELTVVLGPQLPAGGPLATIDVSDTGGGIPPDLAPRIFDSFLTGRPGGTGLGLAIAKRILESHHGDIALVATGPTGTTLRISLPLARN